MQQRKYGSLRRTCYLTTNTNDYGHAAFHAAVVSDRHPGAHEEVLKDRRLTALAFEHWQMPRPMRLVR